MAARDASSEFINATGIFVMFIKVNRGVLAFCMYGPRPQWRPFINASINVKPNCPPPGD